jgi:hypothetical protein
VPRQRELAVPAAGRRVNRVGERGLEWVGVSRRTAERWLGRGLDPIDFLDVRSTGTRDGWPDNWRVILA